MNLIVLTSNKPDRCDDIAFSMHKTNSWVCRDCFNYRYVWFSRTYLGFPLKTAGSNLFSRQHIFDHRFLICMFENPRIIFQTKKFFSDLTLGEVQNSEFWYFYRKVAAVFDAQGSNSFFFLES